MTAELRSAVVLSGCAETMKFPDDLTANEEIARRWTECLASVAAYVRSMTRDFHDAQDILQDVSVAVVRKYREYDRNRPFVAWVLGIARNEILAYRRTISIDRKVFDEAAIEQITRAFSESADQADTRIAALQTCLGRVEGRSRRLIELRYIDDMRYEQMAELMGMTLSAVKVAMHRLRTALRDCIERQLAPRGAR